MPIPKRKINPSNKQKLFERLLAGGSDTRASKLKQQKALVKEMADAKAKRPVAKFNSKGQNVAKLEDEKKKPKAKKKANTSKVTANKEVVKKPVAKKKVAKKKVAKKPEAKKPEAKKPEAKKPVAKKKVAKKKVVKKKVVKTPSKLMQSLKATRGKPPTPKTAQSAMKQSLNQTRSKPKTPKGTSIGPAGERIGGNTSVKKGGRLASVGKNLLRFGGPLAALSVGASVYNAVHPDKVKKRTGESKAGFGTKKKKKKPITSAATATTVANASQTSSESTQGASSSSQSSSFGAAFKKARKAGKSKFSWNGKSYSTATKDDVKKSGSKNLREHLNKQNKKSK